MADLSASGSSPTRPDRASSPFFHSDTTARTSSDGLPPLSLPRRNPGASSTGSQSTSASPPPRVSHSGHRTAHRHNRSSGGFLLSDALDGAVGYDASLGNGVARTGSPGGHTRSMRQSPGKSRTTSGRVHAGHGAAHSGSVRRADTPERLTARAASASSSSGTPTDATAAAARAGIPDNTATLAVDSAQIVHMALKLSETRRLVATHRPLAAAPPVVQNGGVGVQSAAQQPLPPRLTPLPDSAVGGSLRHQLQQQRRVSWTASPRPDKGTPGGGGRTVSVSLSTSATAGNSGPQQPAFDVHSDTPSRFCYNFSPPTLARAQKAKEYIELLAQHRRLLSLLPPLAPPPAVASSRSRAPSFNSLPLGNGTSNTEQPSGTAAASQPLGRPYNPLQYIRNRKVRARERKTIDGPAQGFSDVGKTSAWVDEVEKWAVAVAATDVARSTASAQLPPPLPPFSCADQCNAQHGSAPYSATAASRAAVVAGAGALAKPKRARIDWDIDPADMLADIYWLEQDDNQKLVEDRHWRRVFPQEPGLYRPLSRRTDDSTGAAPPPLPPRHGHNPPDPLAAPLSTLGVDPNDQVLRLPPLFAPLSPSAEDASDQDWSGSTRQRARESARQKLQGIRGFHHRHQGSLRGHPGHSRDHVLRLRRSSSSSSSFDSDSDGRRRRPKVAPGSWPTRVDPSLYGTSYAIPNGTDTQQEVSGSSVPTQAAALNNAASSGGGGGARSSLETPGPRKRLSVDYESSQPTSPELNPLSNTALGFVPTLGDSLSTPPSRAESPPRHHQRFSKVKNIFRDHSHERGRSTAAADRTSDERDAEGQGHGDMLAGATHRTHQQPSDGTAAGLGVSEGSYSVTPVVTINGQDSGHRVRQNSSRSPVRKVNSAGSRSTAPGAFDGGYRTHGSTGSMSGLRHDGSANGVGGGAGTGAGSSGANSSGFRGLMRGARFGSVFQGGVSKVSDMFWRRGPLGGEPSAAGPAGANGHHSTGSFGQNGQRLGLAAAAEAQASSSDEDSDGGIYTAGKTPATTRRGRSRKSALSSRSPSAHMLSDEVSPMTRLPGSQPTAAATGPAAAEAAAGDKRHHYLNVMPIFGRSDSGAPPPAGGASGGDPISRPLSRQSARFDRLKPPRIDVQDVSSRAPSLGPGQRVALRRGSQLDSDMSEADGRVSRSRRSSHVSRASRASAGGMAGGKGGGTGSPQRSRRPRGSHPFGSTSTLSAAAAASVAGDRQGRWSVSQSIPAPGGSLSRRELARLRASLYSSAVLAQELIRRVNEPRMLVSMGWTPGRRRLGAASAGDGDGDGDDDENDNVAVQSDTETEPEDQLFPEGQKRKQASQSNKRPKGHGRDRGRSRSRSSGGLKSVVVVRGSGGAPQWDGHAPAQFLTWADIAAYAPDPEAVAWRPVKAVELYPLAGQVLGAAVQRQGQAWQATAEAFTGRTAPELRARIEKVRTQVAGALSEGARHAADAADEVNGDLVAVQRLQVKRVLDSIDKMSRRRRQRFRWVRRAGWLTVEWVLVGFMWYVWFVVMLVRVVLGAAKGAVAGVRWLLWL